jgi:hypothetical protein
MRARTNIQIDADILRGMSDGLGSRPINAHGILWRQAEASVELCVEPPRSLKLKISDLGGHQCVRISYMISCKFLVASSLQILEYAYRPCPIAIRLNDLLF